MSVASVSEEQSLQRVQQQNQNGASNGARLGGSTTSSAAQASSPTKGGVDLPFGPGNEILNNQPSSPPHNYRHSRAYRHFKNPPQPHMCIRVTTLAGEEVFINVLSWTRIVVPQEPTDPIPLYGGMKVPPGSPRCPPLVYAVMANPEVLKDSGRHSKDPEERRAMVELMCDFVEAMNPDLRLNRNAVILKDRDISGELKDVWNAVQAQRDREREEQMIQQHTHVPPPQQLFPPQKVDAVQLHQQQMGGVQNSSQNNFYSSDNKVTYMELGPDSASVQGNASHASVNSSEHQTSADKSNSSSSVVQSAIISNNANNVKNSVNEVRDENDVNGTNEGKSGSDQTDSPKIVKNGTKDSQTNNSITNLSNRNSKTRSNTSPVNESPNSVTSSTSQDGSSSASSTNTSQNATSPVSPTASSSSIASAASTASASSTAPTTTTATTTTKKEKLGGFLPNSCIFPRFKNKNKDKNKEKEKDKDKEKNSSNHSAKEKTLLNSFKKTTTAATNAFTKSHNHNEDSTTATAMKNCLNLEAEVEKLDLNKMDAPHANEVLIKVATPAAK